MLIPCIGGHIFYGCDQIWKTSFKLLIAYPSLSLWPGRRQTGTIWKNSVPGSRLSSMLNTRESLAEVAT